MTDSRHGTSPAPAAGDIAQPPATEPMVTVDVAGARATLLGTAHVSRASADKVRQLLATGDYDGAAVELCPTRHRSIVDPDSLAKMDLFEMLRSGRTSMITASLALGAYQQRLAEQFGIEPGAEMRAAIDLAREQGLPVLLIDRDIGTTLKRVYRGIPWWHRFTLGAGLLASVVSREKISEQEIERLKEGDILETAFSEFAARERDLYRPLIDERDRYMAARLLIALKSGEYRHLLAVAGAGHLKGMTRYIDDMRAWPVESLQALIAQLETLPPPGKFLKLLPWAIVALIATGFALGFAESAHLGWRMVADWIVINGGLAALGAALALAHPLTIAASFLAAPITSLNPMIGVGMVSAPVELYLRKPTVGDFSALRHDTAHVKGWWKNRVARVLLVFTLTTFGSAAGTYLAGFRIFERLSGA